MGIGCRYASTAAARTTSRRTTARIFLVFFDIRSLLSLFGLSAIGNRTKKKRGRAWQSHAAPYFDRVPRFLVRHSVIKFTVRAGFLTSGDYGASASQWRPRQGVSPRFPC